MLTTVTPAAQEFSMPSSAATPPNDAPYPTLVGTAITGTGTSPPTTLGSAPSMPAITMITAALRSRSVCVRMRWMPATPTSVSRATLLRNARAVTAASSATGRSLVPAVTMRIVPRPVGSGSGVGGRYTVRPSTFTRALGNRAASAPGPRRSRRLLHRASGEVGREDRLRLLHRLDLEEPLAQARRARHALRVPAEVLAKLERRLARVALQPERETRMLERRGEPLVRARVRPRGTAGNEIPGLCEDPGIAERAAGDHDPGAVGVRAHGDDVRRRGDVAVTDHRNVERFDDAGDLVPVRNT